MTTASAYILVKRKIHTLSKSTDNFIHNATKDEKRKENMKKTSKQTECFDWIYMCVSEYVRVVLYIVQSMVCLRWDKGFL